MSLAAQREATPKAGYGTTAENDEACLSPESRRLLEKCTAEIASGSNKEPSVSALISRPVSSDLDVADFQFARPALQMPKLSGRSQARPSGTKSMQETRPEKAEAMTNLNETIDLTRNE